MTRISSLFVATTLAILPVSAFAQQNAAPDKTVAPTSMTAATPATAAPGTDTTVADKTATSPMANVTPPAKTDGKTSATSTKTDTHGMNTAGRHHVKAHVPAKTAEPAKS